MKEIEAQVYSQDGKKVSTIKLPDFVFGLKWNGDLVHQVATSMQSRMRAGIAHARDRSDISGGGRKPWRQKGTGRARHGSTRSPIWRGGGVTHGPTKEKNFSKKINKKMSTKALYTVLSEKLRDGEILFVDKIDLPEVKTKKASSILASLGKIKNFDRLAASKKKIAHLMTFEKNKDLERGFSNLPQISLGEVRNLNPLDVLKYRYLIVTEPQKSVDLLSAKTGKS